MRVQGEYKIVRNCLSGLEPYESPAGSEGLSINRLVSRFDGSVHLEIAIASLAPGGYVKGHIHPFEESFYMLSGKADVGIDASRHTLVAGDFGFVPVSAPHAWFNPFDEPATWYRVRSPQPRTIGAADGTFPTSEYVLPEGGRLVTELDPQSRYLGHFDDDDLPPPGPLAMPGTHGHNIRDVSVRMMVDDVLGSIHHQTFMVQFVASDDMRLSGSPHFHPFEEAYFLLQGEGEVELEGERFQVQAGDLVWEGTGVLHGWRSVGKEPLRFIELMAPRPPHTNMLVSYEIWSALAASDQNLSAIAVGEQSPGS